MHVDAGGSGGHPDGAQAAGQQLDFVVDRDDDAGVPDYGTSPSCAATDLASGGTF